MTFQRKGSGEESYNTPYLHSNRHIFHPFFKAYAICKQVKAKRSIAPAPSDAPLTFASKALPSAPESVAWLVLAAVFKTVETSQGVWWVRFPPSPPLYTLLF